MQLHSPVIIWLLFAASIAVDAVALSQTRSPYGVNAILLDALMVGQLSVACIWSALAGWKNIWLVSSPAFVLAAIALVMRNLGLKWSEALAYYGLHAVLLWSALKLLERTRFWQRRATRIARWQFSVVQLLAAMTIVALLSTALHSSPDFFDESWRINAAFLAGSLGVALANVVCWSFSIHLLLRLAGAVGSAIFLGIAFGLSTEPVGVMYVGLHYLIQSITISAWLGCVGVIPFSERARDENTQTASTPDSPD